MKKFTSKKGDLLGSNETRRPQITKDDDGCYLIHVCPSRKEGSDETGKTGCVNVVNFWKAFGPGECSVGGAYLWRITHMKLGNTTYDAIQLCSILHTPIDGNGLIALAQQLIATKLNIANGADDSLIKPIVASADSKIGSLVIPPIGLGYLAPAEVQDLVDTLEVYNEGGFNVPAC